MYPCLKLKSTENALVLMILWVEESKTLAMKPSSCLNYVVAEDCSQSCEAEEWALLLFWEVVNLQVKFKFSELSAKNAIKNQVPQNSSH